MDVVLGHFGVEVLEPCPVPCGGPLLLLECLVLGDSMDVSGAVTLCGDCLAHYFTNNLSWAEERMAGTLANFVPCTPEEADCIVGRGTHCLLA